MKKPRTRPAALAGPAAVGDAAARGPLTPEERYRLIAEAAYRRAEQRGFEGGDPIADWLEAEREVDGRPDTPPSLTA